MRSKGNKKWFYICVVVPDKLPVYTRKGSEFQQGTQRMARIYATRTTTSIKTNSRRRHFVFLEVIKIYPSTLLS